MQLPQPGVMQAVVDLLVQPISETTTGYPRQINNAVAITEYVDISQWQLV